MIGVTNYSNCSGELSAMYLSNKYTQWYKSIIATAQHRNLSTETYTEKHHIIPKSLGGDDSKNNLVKLTAKEHYICHLLLIKMLADKLLKRKIQFALNSFRRRSATQQRIILNSKQYEFIRKQVSIARSEALKGNTYSSGRIVSLETRAKMSSSMKGQKKRSRTEKEKQQISQFHKGKILSEETKQKMRKPKPFGFGDKVRQANLGKNLSVETKRKISESHKGKVVVKKECPHCGKLLDAGNFAKHQKY